MDKHTLLNYFSGKASAAEKEEILKYIETPEHKEEIFRMKELWNLRKLNEYESEELIEAALRKLNEKIDKRRQDTVRHRILRFSSYAAILAVILTCSFILVFPYGHKEYITYSTNANDSVKAILLEDGTKVWLNQSSTLRVEKPFSKKERKTYLTGEAYFEVSKDKQRPFKVDAGFSQIQVLGTAFNAKIYKAAQTIEATLAQGAILLKDKQGKNLARLHPGEQAVYNNKNEKLDIQKVSTDIYSCWRFGQYIFDNSTLKEISEHLERIYHVSIHFENKKLEELTFRCVFNKNETLDDAMQILTLLSPIDYSIKENKIYIKAK